jgi:hypothetical protein
VTVTAEPEVDRERVTGRPLYAYGIVRAGSAAPAGAGIGGKPLTTVESGELAAIVTPVAGVRVRAKRRDLLRHSEVLQDAFASGTVLPLRFGLVFPSADVLQAELLEPRRVELGALLERFDGLGELRLRVSYHDQDQVLAELVRQTPALSRLRESTHGRSGSDPQLLRLGEAVAHAYAARRSGDAEAIVSRLAACAEQVQVDETRSEVEVIRASFLVRRNGVARFDELLESVALRERHRMQFTCTGPVPPHSFVDVRGGA